VRLALAEKGVAYRLAEVEIFGPDGVPAEHLERHPFGRIPVLQHGDFFLYESAAITRYVDEAFAGPPLQPAPGQPRARMSQIIGLLDAYAYRPMVWDIFVQRISIPRHGGSADEGKVRKAIPMVTRCLEQLEDFLAGRSFLVGEGLTLADLHAAPMLLYLQLTAEGRALLAGRARLSGWLQAMKARPSVIGTRSVYEQPV
jgi:glutathione S-transferase